MLATIFLQRYETVGFLGQGSMGKVYLARPLDDPDHLVVVKVMQTEMSREARFRQLFERELHTMAEFRHPYAVQLYDGSLDDPNGPCIVMEYIPGQTLEDVLIRDRFLEVHRVSRFLGPLCHALQAAHEMGIIHRDLKPANLMVVDPGMPGESLKVMDLGLAQLAVKPYIPLEKLTGRGPTFIAGTPTHVCPEQIEGYDIDGRADIYSVGVILFELLTGTLPFTQLDPQELLEAHLRMPPPRFRQFLPSQHIPPAIEELVQCCLAKYPNERPQTAQELAERFSAAVGYNIWNAALPDGWENPPRPAKRKPRPKPASRYPSNDLHQILHQFEAWMPEQIAVVKLRGFIEAIGGTVVASEPGQIQVSLGEPSQEPETVGTGQGFMGWLRRVTGNEPPPSPVVDPISIWLEMEKPDPRDTQLRITVRFRPLEGHPLQFPHDWRARCEQIQTDLRAYLIANQ